MSPRVDTAAVLVGGKGERLKTLFPDIPKPLVPVAGEPFLDHFLRSLKPLELKKVVLLAGYQAEKFAGYSQRGGEFGFSIELSVEQEPLGSGGALRLAEPLIQGPEFLVFNGDTYFEGALAPLLNCRLGAHLGAIGLLNVAKADRFGTVTLAADQSIHEFREKRIGASGLVNMGVWKFKRDLLKLIPTHQFISLEREFFEKRPKDFLGTRLDGNFTDIGVPEDYQAFNRKMAE